MDRHPKPLPEFHAIRLHGPWQARVLERFSSEPTEGRIESRIKIDSNWHQWPGREFRGRITCRRSFQRPTGLEVSQQVFLAIEQPGIQADCYLNGESIGQWRLGDPGMRVEIRHQLRPVNELVIELELPADFLWQQDGWTGVMIGDVRLEIAENERGDR